MRVIIIIKYIYELFSATRKHENGIASNRKFRIVTVNMLSSFVHTARHTMGFFYLNIYINK